MGLQKGGAAGEQAALRQHVAGVRSGVALSKLLHADAYIVLARQTLATLAMDCTSMTRLGDGILEVGTRIGLFCCEARRWDESRMLNKMGRKIYD